MKEIEQLLGQELYEQVKSKTKELNIIVDDGKLIPKYRFDCINLSLKDQKAKVAELELKVNEIEKVKEELNKYKSMYLEEKIKSENLYKVNLVLNEICRFKPKNIKSVFALIDFAEADGENFITNIVKQIENIKKAESYLFLDDISAYYMIPCNPENNQRAKHLEKQL